MLAISNRRVLFHIAPSRCLRMHNLFGQRHLTTETCCKVWTQETHCSCTRHVPRRVPRPCPCTTGVMKSRTDHLSAVTHAAEAATQETHCSCTRHVPRRVPRPCPCTTGVMKSTTDHLSAITHAAEATAQKTHCNCTRHVPRRVPRPCPCTTGNEMKNRSFISSAAEAAHRRHTAVALGTYQGACLVHARAQQV